MTTPPPDAAHFDEWYAGLDGSAASAELTARTLGLPAGLESSSLLPGSGIGDVVDELRVGAGDVLVDLGCGRGGYGREVARRTGARLVGVDFSAVAIARARERATDTATFVVGDLTATGLDDASARAVMCIDAMQFAEPYAAGLRECRRILVPGGRLVLTGWQALDPADPEVPVRARHDIAAELRAAGFVEVSVAAQPAWRAAEHEHWATALAVDAAGDPGLASLQKEARAVLCWLDRTRRVLATGTAPRAS